MKNEKQQFLINEDLPLRKAMKWMSDFGKKNLFIVNKKNILLGSLSDGDIRKWILSCGSLNDQVRKIINRKPKTVNNGYKVEEVKKIMLKHLIGSVPVISSDGIVEDVLTWEKVFSGQKPSHKKRLNLPVVIMAGGEGKRLDPFTRVLPKPLIPIGEKPIIEIIMDRFGEYGVKDVFLTVNHKAKMIKSYFDDSTSDYNIKYIEETKPLGTAGSLKLLKSKVKGPFIVTNCDILIESAYDEIVDYHKYKKNDITIVVSCRHYIIPYGVCSIENGGDLKQIKEKPEYELLVSTGMYVLNSNLLEMIPEDKFFNFTDLIEKSKAKGYKVGVFPISENDWIDIGQWDEYKKAVEKMRLE